MFNNNTILNQSTGLPRIIKTTKIPISTNKMNVKYIKKWTIDNLKAKSPVDHDGHNLTLVGDDDDISPCLIIEQDDVGINESQEIRDIAADYHRRLQEQVTLAKQDIVQELENHIQVSDKKKCDSVIFCLWNCWLEWWFEICECITLHQHRLGLLCECWK